MKAELKEKIKNHLLSTGSTAAGAAVGIVAGTITAHAQNAPAEDPEDKPEGEATDEEVEVVEAQPAPAPQPAPHNPEPAPHNPEPAPHNPEPAPHNPEPAPHNPEPAPHNPDPHPEPDPNIYNPDPDVPGPGPEDDRIYIISYDRETLEDGSQADFAVVEVNGERMVIIDSNLDGNANYIIYDSNHDGEIDDNEIEDVSGRSFSMAEFQEAAGFDPANPGGEIDVVDPIEPQPEPDPEPDGGLEVISYDRVTFEDGSQTDFAEVEFNGERIILGDSDLDGKADFLYSDDNHNGQIDPGEVVDIRETNLDMTIMQQQAGFSPEFAQNNIPDYVDDADVSGFTTA